MIHGAPAGDVVDDLVNDAVAGTLRRPFASGAPIGRLPVGGPDSRQRANGSPRNGRPGNSRSGNSRPRNPGPTTMTSANRAQVERSLDLLRRGLAPFVERELRRAVEARRQDADFLRTVAASARQMDTPLAQWDAAALLRTMWDLWTPVFRFVLGFAERCLVSELRTHRNNWAHRRPFSDDNAYRAVDSAARLLAAVSAPEAVELETLKAGLKADLPRGRFEPASSGLRRAHEAPPIPRPPPPRDIGAAHPRSASRPERPPPPRDGVARRPQPFSQPFSQPPPPQPAARPFPDVARPRFPAAVAARSNTGGPGLRPLPAVPGPTPPRVATDDRRRVLIGCDPPNRWPGSFTDWACSMIRLADGGVSFADLHRHLSDRYLWSYSTVEVKINGFTMLGCLRRDDGRIEITDRGRRFLETDGDPDLLRDRLLRHILGVPELLAALDTPRSANDLRHCLRPLKPSWQRSDAAARQLIILLRRLGVIAKVARAYRLTERGQHWRRAIPGDPPPSPPTT